MECSGTRAEKNIFPQVFYQNIPCIICCLHSINAVIFSNDHDQTINVLYLGTKPMWTSFAASRKFQSHIVLKPIVNISLETAS